MRVNKLFIERKLKELNDWVQDNPGHELERIKKQSISYYACKAQEMEENQLQTIEVWSITTLLHLGRF